MSEEEKIYDAMLKEGKSVFMPMGSLQGISKDIWELEAVAYAKGATKYAMKYAEQRSINKKIWASFGKFCKQIKNQLK